VNYALDASAMIAYLNGEPGGLVVRQLLTNPDANCYAHAVNRCEVFYGYVRDAAEQTARNALATLYADGVRPRQDMAPEFWMDVGRIKARGRIALGDCFCVALARAIGGEAETSDHAEFDPLVPDGVCPVLFIR
jgi:uncharacterized protein with PIN domain